MLNQLIKKVCSKCKSEKPLKDFYKDRRILADGRVKIVSRTRCKECDKKKAMAYQNAHLERTREIRKKAREKFYALHPDYDRLRIRNDRQYKKRLCNKCRRKFSSDLIQIMFIDGQYFKICPICAFKIMNEATGLPIIMPFQEKQAQLMLKRALMEVRAYRKR